jgi:DNA-binding response OmpR family regulator
MQRFLKQEGYSVSVADGGSSARRLVLRSEFDLILLDLRIPEEGGLSLLRLFKATIDVPIIIVSGKAKVVDRVLGLEMGADDYISKPFNLRELQARIKAVLRRTASVSQSSKTRSGEYKVSKLIRFADWEFNLGNRELRATGNSFWTGPPIVTGRLSTGASTPRFSVCGRRSKQIHDIPI